jgi:hypothetical protein
MNLQAQYDSSRMPFVGKDTTVTQGYLRSEVLLTTQTAINFNFMANQPNVQGAILATESRLNISDSFVTTHIGLFLKKIASATPTDAQQATALLYSYRNPATGLFDGANDANLQALFNGRVTFSVNRREYLSRFSAKNFERVPATQQGAISAAVISSVPTITTYPIARDEWPNALYGYYGLYPFVNFGGNDTVQIQNLLPAAVTMNETGESNYAVMILQGYYVQNGANFVS